MPRLKRWNANKGVPVAKRGPCSVVLATAVVIIFTITWFDIEGIGEYDV